MHATPSPGMVVRACVEPVVGGCDCPRQGQQHGKKGQGAHADKGQGKGWGVPLGSGTSHKGCYKGHQGQHAHKGKPVAAKGWGAHPGHADKGKPVEGKGWGVHPRSWPSDKGLQGKRADKGKPVEGKGKGGEPEHKPNAKGSAQWKLKSGKQTAVEQASKSDTSGTSENKSEDKEEENEKDAMSASKEEEEQTKGTPPEGLHDGPKSQGHAHGSQCALRTPVLSQVPEGAAEERRRNG